jgi:hypothetical protein
VLLLIQDVGFRRQNWKGAHFLETNLKLSTGAKVKCASFIRSNLMSWFGIVTGYELDCPDSILGSAARFFLPHSVQAECGALPVSYPMGTGGAFAGG